MKPILAALLSLVLFSCTRTVDTVQNNNASLEGAWRMIAVKDNSTNLIHVKPGAITGEVIAHFVAVNSLRGFISGNTPSQPFEAEYELSPVDGVSIPIISYSKIAETSWGIDFLHNIVSADNYSFEQNGLLRIHTAKNTLYFKKD